MDEKWHNVNHMDFAYLLHNFTINYLVSSLIKEINLMDYSVLFAKWYGKHNVLEKLTDSELKLSNIDSKKHIKQVVKLEFCLNGLDCEEIERFTQPYKGFQVAPWSSFRQFQWSQMLVLFTNKSGPIIILDLKFPQISDYFLKELSECYEEIQTNCFNLKNCGYFIAVKKSKTGSKSFAFITSDLKILKNSFYIQELPGKFLNLNWSK